MVFRSSGRTEDRIHYVCLVETQLTEMHWPSGAEIPNGRFLRKHAIVPKGEPMPKAILVSPRQLSMNEKDAEYFRGTGKCP
jgi:hypothetical protein